MTLLSLLRRLHREERGQTILFLALMFVILLGFTAMVSDVGIAYWNRRLLQNAVDSAALAGASQLASAEAQQGSSALGATAALTAAGSYAQNNGVAASELLCNAVSGPVIGCPVDPNPADAPYEVQVTTTFNPSDTVVVSARRHDDFGLRYFIGAGSTDIVATAAAIITPVSPGSGDLLPWALPSDPTNPCYANLKSSPPGPPPANPTVCTIHYGPPPPLGPGNFGSVSYPGENGKNDYRNDIKYGYQGSVPMPTSLNPPSWSWNITTDPGAGTGPTDQGVSQLMTWDQNKQCRGGSASCASLYGPSPGAGQNPDPYNPQTTDGTVCATSTACPRVGIIPILSDQSFGNGRSGSLTVVGFQCFYIQNYSGKVVTGFFLGTCVPSANGGSRQGLYGNSLTSSGEEALFLWR